MNTITKIALGLSFIATTHLMAAKSANETIGNAVYAKAYINCEVDKKKDFVKDTVNVDSIGFDYTKFIPLLATKGSVNCTIKGNIQLPDDFSGDTVDIEAGKPIGYIDRDKSFYDITNPYCGGNGHNYNAYNLYAAITFNGQLDQSILREAPDQCRKDFEIYKAGRYFNIPVRKYLGLKYIEFEISAQAHGVGESVKEKFELAVPLKGINMEKFFKIAENFDIKYMKTAQSRGEKTEMISLDKFFILQRK
jgi:hypothetical protein